MVCLVYDLSFELLSYTIVFILTMYVILLFFKLKVAQLYLPVVARCKFYLILKNNQFTRKYNFSSFTRPLR